MNLFRYSDAMLPFPHLQSHHGARFHHDGRGTMRRIDRHLLMLFMRNHVVPPANHRAKCNHRSHRAHHPVRHQARKQQRDPERKHHRPESRRRHLDMRLLAPLSRFAVMNFMSHVRDPLLAEADDVHHGKNHHPDSIHKMPVPGKKQDPPQLRLNRKSQQRHHQNQ